MFTSTSTQPIETMFRNKATGHFEKAKSLLNELVQYVSFLFEEDDESEGEDAIQSTSLYIQDGIAKITTICRELTSAVQFDYGRGFIDISGLLRRLRAFAKVFNLVLQSAYPTSCLCISIQYKNTPSNPYIKMILEKLPSVKGLKEIVVVHEEIEAINCDGLISCDCPICYETVNKTMTVYTNCSHGFCVTCTKALITSVGRSVEEKKPVCPLCRVEIQNLKTGNLDGFNELQTHLSML